MLRIQSLRSWLIALVVATAGTAAAQDPEVSSRSELSAASGPAQGIDLSAEKMFEQAKLYVQKMQSAIKRGDKQRQEVQEQKDLVKLNCLNEKMTQAAEHVREAEHALSELADAVVNSDSVSRQHEFTRLRILHQKVLVLSAEANNCAGEDSGFVGPEKHDVEVDLSVPGGDPTDPGLPTPDSTMAPAGTDQSAQPSSPTMPDDSGPSGG